MTNLEMLKAIMEVLSKDATYDVNGETVNLYDKLAEYINTLEVAKKKRSERDAKRRASKWEKDNAEIVAMIEDAVKENEAKTYTYKALTDLVNEKNNTNFKSQKIMAIVKKIGEDELGITIEKVGSKRVKKSDTQVNAEVSTLKGVITNGKAYTYKDLQTALASIGVDYTTRKITAIVKAMENNGYATINRKTVKGQGKSKITELVFNVVR